MPTLPSRDVLRAEFDAAVLELDRSRPGSNLTTDFYSRIGDSVFEAGYSALADTCGAEGKPKARLHVVSAPVGSGKTSFSLALVAAVTRLAEHCADAPFGCAYVVDQIPKADALYRELDALLPGKVAVWSTEHDVNCKHPEKLLKPAAQFSRDELPNFPVVVVTHKFFGGKNGHKAKMAHKDGGLRPRALTVVDERPEDVDVLVLQPSAAHRVRELVQRDEQHSPTVVPHMDELVRFMTERSLDAGGSLEKPTDAPEAWSVAERLAWFNTAEAENYVRANAGNTDVATVFGFAKSLGSGYAFIARSSGGTHFIGYESNLMVAPGMMLLDATADIDGVSQLCPWREVQEVPQARYDNLQIVHVPSYTKTKLYKLLKTAKERREYATWMVEIIKEHMEPGQKGLAVCKHTLFENENVPTWPQGDDKHKDRKRYTEDFGWDIEGRKLCATHWGTGIGVNTWKDVDVVFLFGEFHLQRQVSIAHAQGLQRHKSTEGALGRMKTLNSKAAAVDTLHEGHLLRVTKQMALRGRGRCYDEHGKCGEQKLVLAGFDLKRLLANAERLFPGAQITTSGKDTDGHRTRADALLEILGRPGLPNVVTTKWISQQMTVPWRDVGKHVKHMPAVQQGVAALGWTYDGRKGRGGSAFRRTRSGETPAGSAVSHSGALEALNPLQG